MGTLCPSGGHDHPHGAHHPRLDKRHPQTCEGSIRTIVLPALKATPLAVYPERSRRTRGGLGKFSIDIAGVTRYAHSYNARSL